VKTAPVLIRIKNPKKKNGNLVSSLSPPAARRHERKERKKCRVIPSRPKMQATEEKILSQ
jgi:hypothetical protein